MSEERPHPIPGATDLAWKLAKRAKLRTPTGGGMIAEFPLPSGESIYGEGNTSTTAIRDLADHIDLWGRDA